MPQTETSVAEELFSVLSDEATLGTLGQTLTEVADDSGRLIIKLSDLMEDDNGEVVLFNDSHVPSLALETESRVIARGETQGHMTAAGEDVSGFQFLSFDSGITLYFREGLDLIIVGAAESPTG